MANEFDKLAVKFEWSDKLSVGNDQMDSEHKILIGYLNAIGGYKAQFEAGEKLSTTAVASVIKRLIDYTVFHFRDEEALLAKYSYPNIESHKAIHRHLIEQLTMLNEKFNSQGVAVVPVLFTFVSVWLKDHIMGVDQRYTKYVGKKDRN